MKLVIATLVAGLGLMACQDNGGGGSSASLKTESDSVSYAIGMNMGKGIKQDSLDINPDLIAAGIRDAMADKPKLTDSVAQQALMSFQQKMMVKAQEKMARQQDSLNKAGEDNKKKADEFMAANKGKEGVVTLPSGVQYKVISSGSGATPSAGDNVKVHYKGTLVDGTEFDSSISKGEPATFNVSGVIPGWSEALQKMKVGDKWMLFIPPDLGYGMNPPPGSKIPPGAALIFEVELLEIPKADSAGK